MNYTPILIPTLNRYNHLKRCVESLAKCTHADKTDLYIALDYPLKEENCNYNWRYYLLKCYSYNNFHFICSYYYKLTYFWEIY